MQWSSHCMGCDASSPGNMGRPSTWYFRPDFCRHSRSYPTENGTNETPAYELTGTLKKIKETGAVTIGYRDSSIPFSYLDDNQKPIGFAIDICYRIVDAVKQELDR